MSKKEQESQGVNDAVKTLIEELTALSFINNSFNSKEDNWSGLSYGQRYLDAFARILHVHSDCTAIVEEKTSDKAILGLALAYNPLSKKEKDVKNKKVLELLKLEELINTAISKNANETDIIKLVLHALQYSDNYSPSKVFGLKFDLPFARKYSHFHVELKVVERTLEQKIKNNVLSTREEAEVYNEQFELYLKYAKEIKTLLGEKGEHEKNNGSSSSSSSSVNYSEYCVYKEIYKVVLRPINDTLKLIQHLKEKGILEVKIDLMDDADAHAEIVLKTLDPQAVYIGISKLSCVLCEAFLTSKETPPDHRGTSGAFYASWGNLEQIEVTEQFKQSLEGIRDKLIAKYKSPEILKEEITVRFLKGSENKNVRDVLEKHKLLINHTEVYAVSGLSQYHDLSDDESEKEILVIGQGSLFELKQFDDYDD